MNILNTYNNGDFSFTIYDDGTLIRECDIEDGKTDFPTSIDIKLTNYCNLGCKFCHESSTTEGLHGDLDKLFDIIKVLPSGVEIALGGGDPLSHPDLLTFLKKVKNIGLISNITVNQGHLKEHQQLLTFLIKEDLVKGVGISITSNNFTYIKPLLEITNNIVFHLIAGVNDIKIIDKLMSLGNYCKILVLGYKMFGFGVNYYNENVNINLKEWYKVLPSYIGKCTISFDNLAIDQLKVKRLFTIEGWERFYMGDDFCFTMYIDAVKQEFSPTSRTLKGRKLFNEITLLEYFKNR
jgi:hypothetical protein